VTDDPFFGVVSATPGDDTARRVYADWLEERDDPRAAFLRLEVETAALPLADARRAALQARLLEAAAGIDLDWLFAVSRVPIVRSLGLVGSWHLEGLTALVDQPDPDESVWKPYRAAPRSRGAFRRIGYVFRADGTGQAEGRHVPALQPLTPFIWHVEAEGNRLYLTSGPTESLTGPAEPLTRIRIWVRPDGRMLWAIPAAANEPWVAHLMIRDNPPPTFPGAPRIRRRT
jgi:uncharacterized protein (TIGR02996 family)